MPNQSSGSMGSIYSKNLVFRRRCGTCGSTALPRSARWIHMAIACIAKLIRPAWQSWENSPNRCSAVPIIDRRSVDAQIGHNGSVLGTIQPLIESICVFVFHSVRRCASLDSACAPFVVIFAAVNIQFAVRVEQRASGAQQ